MRQPLIIILLFFGIIATAQKKIYNAEDLSITPLIDGTLIVPETSEKLPLAIIIGGSGPTDRNGNQQMLENNSSKFLAEGLYENNIATFRYDKRIVKQMKQRSVDEKRFVLTILLLMPSPFLNISKTIKGFQKFILLGIVKVR